MDNNNFFNICQAIQTWIVHFSTGLLLPYFLCGIILHLMGGGGSCRVPRGDASAAALLYLCKESEVFFS